MIILTTNPDFNDLALAELHQAAATATVRHELSPGVWLIDLPDGFASLAAHWQTHPPIFVRHICPVQMTVDLTETAVSHLPTLLLHQLGNQFQTGLPFSVQTRTFATPLKPFDLNQLLAPTIQARTGAPLNVRLPQQIVSVVICHNTAYLGFSLTAQNLSDWGGGVHRFARETEQISRAEFKLLEALETFHITLPPRGVALDLGAAPGGWTRVLCQHEQYVTAVDPAPLHPSLQSRRTIRYRAMTAETYLSSYPDAYDLIVNDMRQSTRDSARLMVQFAPYLYAHGFALMTLKLPEHSRYIPAIIDQTFAILQPHYQIVAARQLFHNRSEITLYLRPQR